MFKRVVLTAVAVAGMSAAAIAADMPVKAPVYKAAPAVFNWSGYYVGAHVGYGRLNTNWTNTAGVTTGDFDGDGVLGGLTVGFNRQAAGSNIVWGLEADYSFSGVEAGFFGGVCGASTCLTELRHLGTFRGRLGVAVNRSLFYGTAGATVANVRNSGLPIAGFESDTVWGWTAGAGWEFAIAHGWSGKVEYLFVGLEDATYTLGVLPIAAQLDLHIVRAGINRRF